MSKNSKEKSHSKQLVLEHVVNEYRWSDFSDIEILKKGGFAKVYSAYHPVLEKVAVKKLIDGPISKEEFIEAKLLAQSSDHPHIVRLLGLLVNNTGTTKCIGIIMELMGIGCLSEVIHDPTKNYDIPQRCRWIVMIASAVGFLHGKGIIHRDINPNNTLLGHSWNDLKITDLGFAKKLAFYQSLEKGTPSYMAPEVMTEENYSEPADIYSFGITVWEIFYRKEPYNQIKGKTTKSVMDYVKAGKRPLLDNSFSPKLSKFLKSTWNAKPVNRPKADEFIDFFKEYEESEKPQENYDDTPLVKDKDFVKVTYNLYEAQATVIEKEAENKFLREELEKSWIHIEKVANLTQQVDEIKNGISNQKAFTMSSLTTLAKQVESKIIPLQETTKILVSKVERIEEENKKVNAQQAKHNELVLTALTKTLAMQSESEHKLNELMSRIKSIPEEVKPKLNEGLVPTGETQKITKKAEENSTLITQEIGAYSAPMPEPPSSPFNSAFNSSSTNDNAILSVSQLAMNHNSTGDYFDQLNMSNVSSRDRAIVTPLVKTSNVFKLFK